MITIKFFTEAVIVGIMTVLIGYISGYIVHQIYPTNFLPNVCSTWNKYYVMEKTLFLTGVLVHLICELTGINNWYCKNGNACLGS